MTAVLTDIAMLYPIALDLYGEWSRDVPWKVVGPFMVTTYSRTAIDGKHQVAQVRIRRDLFQRKFAEVDLAARLRAADYVDRCGRLHRPSFRRRR